MNRVEAHLLQTMTASAAGNRVSTPSLRANSHQTPLREGRAEPLRWEPPPTTASAESVRDTAAGLQGPRVSESKPSSDDRDAEGERRGAPTTPAPPALEGVLDRVCICTAACGGVVGGGEVLRCQSSRTSAKTRCLEGSGCSTANLPPILRPLWSPHESAADGTEGQHMRRKSGRLPCTVCSRKEKLSMHPSPIRMPWLLPPRAISGKPGFAHREKGSG